MDKFGIFNLLGSLLNKSNQENSSPANDFGSISTDQVKEKTDVFTAPLPLQAGMIDTMTNHDEFIKRVKQKNKTK